MANKIPLLIIGDGPSLNTGLARIARDLTRVAKTFPELDVAQLCNGTHRDILSEKTYALNGPFESCGEFDMPSLENVFFEGRKPIIWHIWDATRAMWSNRYDWPNGASLWGYFPLDSVSLHGMQPEAVLNNLSKFRIVVPSKFAKTSLAWLGEDTEVIPHGFDREVFYPRDGLQPNVIGIVATNQKRKDWAMMAEVCSELSKEDDSMRFWWHTDKLDGCWNFALLISEFGLTRRVTLTHTATDEVLAKMYSQCRLTLAPGLGEGFGYPILESIACGTPVVHGEYGAGREIIRPVGGGVVPCQTWRWDATSFPTKRPVYELSEWLRVIRANLKIKETFGEDRIADSVREYRWDKLEPKWARWIAEGIQKHAS